MPTAYTYDLRIRVIQFIEENNSIQKASEVFKISKKVIVDWKKRKRETGDIKRKSHD